MQHLQAVIVRNSKSLGFCFGGQESEPYPRTQMLDRPAHSSHFLAHFLLRRNAALIKCERTGNPGHLRLRLNKLAAVLLRDRFVFFEIPGREQRPGYPRTY